MQYETTGESFILPRRERPLLAGKLAWGYTTGNAQQESPYLVEYARWKIIVPSKTKREKRLKICFGSMSGSFGLTWNLILNLA